MERILVVEDDVQIQNFMIYALEKVFRWKAP